jgi:hypothetical protein
MAEKVTVEKVEQVYLLSFEIIRELEFLRDCKDLLDIDNVIIGKIEDEIEESIEKAEIMFEEFRSLRSTAYVRVCNEHVHLTDPWQFAELKSLSLEVVRWLKSICIHKRVSALIAKGQVKHLSSKNHEKRAPKAPLSYTKIKQIKYGMDFEKLVIVDYLQSNYSKSTQAVKTKSHSSKGQSKKKACADVNSTKFLELCLDAHHGVNSGKYKYEAVGVRALADGKVEGLEKIEMSAATISRAFNVIFPGEGSGHTRYKNLCDSKCIINYLTKKIGDKGNNGKVRDQEKNDSIINGLGTYDSMPDLD